MESNNDNSTNSWNEYQKLVLHELQEHRKELKLVFSDIQNIHIELATLKVKSGIWGLVSGAIPVVIAALLKVLI